MAKINLKTTINKKSPEKFARDSRKNLARANKGNPEARREVERLFKEYVRSNSLAMPRGRARSKADIRGDIENISNIFPSLDGYRETNKSIGVSIGQREEGKSGLALSDVSLTKKESESFVKEFKEKTKTKAGIQEFIKANPVLHNKIKKDMLDRYSNLAVVHNVGSEKPFTTFFPNASKKLQLSNLNNMEIKPVITENKAGDIRVTLDFRLTEQAYKKYLISAQNITEEFHRGMAKSVGTKFKDYAMKKIKQKKGKGDNAMVAEVLAFANEFDATASKKGPVTFRSKMRADINKFAKNAIKFDALGRTRHLFLSSVQFTALVQQKLGQTMERKGKAQPPWMKERSGRFRSSIRVFPNYRTGTIKYSFMQLYSHNEIYRYRVYEQIERAISDVAKVAFKKAFKVDPVGGKDNQPPGYIV